MRGLNVLTGTIVVALAVGLSAASAEGSPAKPTLRIGK
jgi:hypothetical protein